jgi:hypothetical protein
MAYPRFRRARAHRITTIAALTPNATAITEFATLSGGPGTGGYDITLGEVQVGDVLEATLVARLDGAAVYVGIDIATIVSGAIVNWYGDGLSASLASSAGVNAWLVPNLANRYPISGSVWRTVVSGDINSSGQVVSRLYVANSAATARQFMGTGRLMVKNLGPVQA